ncbi:CoA-substrate-specific enzyme activase [Desulfatibacillum aliphaticivorans]|uniref:CoA-substrate-specific enzyme activase n=1 Tax=Desulfatibacillum aliphaticivorans TaxID=218208 RepID=B8FCB2_DESAL|nr:acyl-CoA dehydratase activase [Desulfatibacillum aliphaticivorans]ACL05530.1 CoA-substrate-specific enzyme activase [Desulfatibacillum aliphaticivorans]
MFYAGCDVGSLTAEAVIMEDGRLRSWAILPVGARTEDSAYSVMQQALKEAGLTMDGLALICATGYGRKNIPFAQFNLSEISCHGMGAHWCDPSIRAVIDVGGQDCKAICLDSQGRAVDFVMNDKCAAGTGRSLEILARAINLGLEDLGPVSLKSRHPVRITNRCSIFMELEVLQHYYGGRKIRDIARGINHAVAKRVAFLAQSLNMAPGFALTGGVSKNAGVAKSLEKILGVRFRPLKVDPQLMGALGAAVHAGVKAGVKDS